MASKYQRSRTDVTQVSTRGEAGRKPLTEGILGRLLRGGGMCDLNEEEVTTRVSVTACL